MHFDDKPPKCYWDHDAIMKIGQYFITYKKVRIDSIYKILKLFQ